MDKGAQRRVAANEARFREVNEAIERGVWPGDEDSCSAFCCECARADCNRLVSITPREMPAAAASRDIAPREYERIRAHSRRFLVLPGHEQLEVDTVVETHAGHLVVEKRDEAGRLADASDPRS